MPKNGILEGKNDRRKRKNRRKMNGRAVKIEEKTAELPQAAWRRWGLMGNLKVAAQFNPTCAKPPMTLYALF